MKFILQEKLNLMFKVEFNCIHADCTHKYRRIETANQEDGGPANTEQFTVSYQNSNYLLVMMQVLLELTYILSHQTFGSTLHI